MLPLKCFDMLFRQTVLYTPTYPFQESATPMRRLRKKARLPEVLLGAVRWSWERRWHVDRLRALSEGPG